MQCTYYNTYYLIQLRKKSNYINMRARVYISHPARGALRRIVLLCRLQRTSRRICTHNVVASNIQVFDLFVVLSEATHTHTLRTCDTRCSMAKGQGYIGCDQRPSIASTVSVSHLLDRDAANWFFE